MVKRGFSLIEVLVVCSILIVVLDVVASSLIGGWRSEQSQELANHLQRSSRSTVEELSRQTLQSSSVMTSTTDALTGTTYTSSSSQLVLRLSPLDASNNILSGDDFMIFRIDPNNSSRVERITLSTTGTRSTGVKSVTINTEAGAITFRYFNTAGVELSPANADLSTTKKVIIKVQTTGTTFSRTLTQSFEEAVLLRNKAQ